MAYSKEKQHKHYNSSLKNIEKKTGRNIEDSRA